MKTICFVCTGNIFRSLSAEYCLRQLLPKDSEILVRSAGLTANPQAIHSSVVSELSQFGIDVSKHVQTKLTQEIVDSCDVVIAMAQNHKDYIKTMFNRDVPLFLEVCTGKQIPIMDVNEAIDDFEKYPEASAMYIKTVVDLIYDETPKFMENMGEYFQNKQN